MDSSTLKFFAAAGIAVAVLYVMRSERYQAFDESERSRFEGNAAYGVPTPALSPSVKKSTMLAATTQHTLSGGTAPNLLPKPKADDGFGQFAPDPGALAGKNFVDASRWVSLGAMTSRRNISRDIRDTIPIPKTNALSPWNQSTIEQQQIGKGLGC